MNVGILGGGITGITLQRYLDDESEVLEAASRPGGLCSTIYKDGFGYDIGGHILFSKHQEINQLVEELLGDNCGYARRANQIYFKNRFVKYPFENGLGVLDKEDIFACLNGYLNARPVRRTDQLARVVLSPLRQGDRRDVLAPL